MHTHRQARCALTHRQTLTYVVRSYPQVLKDAFTIYQTCVYCTIQFKQTQTVWFGSLVQCEF